jgi:hypothetical protein
MVETIDKCPADVVSATGYSVTDIQICKDILSGFANVLNPIADMTWTKDGVKESIEKVRAAMVLGILDGDDALIANDVITSLSEAAKGSGHGGTRTRNEQPDIEGRPLVIRVLDTEGIQVSKQAGNKATSVGNIKAAIVRWLDKNGVTVTESQDALIKEAVRESVVNGKPEVAVGDFCRLIHG